MRIFIFFILIIFTNYLLSQQVMQFYGLGKSDVISSMAKPIDGGLIFAGSTTTFSSGGSDLWVMKSDDSLNFEWQRNFGNASDEFGREIFLNKDEIIIIGQRIYKSSSVIWILAMNHKGEKIWDKIHSIKNNIILHSIEKIDESGYLITGEEVTKNNSLQGFIMLLDGRAELVWKKVYGGKFADGLLQTKKVEDGFISIGYTNSFRENGLNVPEATIFQRIKRIFIKPKLSQEVWFMQLDENGKKVLEKTYGGERIDIGKFIFSPSDSTHLIIGETRSFKKSEGDIWLIEVDENGNEIWNKTYGGKSSNRLTACEKMNNGNYLLALKSKTGGLFPSRGKNSKTRNILIDKHGKVVYDAYPSDQETHFSNRICILGEKVYSVGYKLIPFEEQKARFESLINSDLFPEKLMASVFEIDSLGESMNSSVFSSDRFEYGVKLLETRKNNFTAVANVDTYNNGENDISFLQFNNEDATIKPNSILETGNQIPKDFEVTSDGGLFVIGEVLSTKYAGIDLFIHRYDRNQNRSWGNEFGGFGNDIGLDAVLSKDGGMITVGSTDSFGRGGTDGWLVKVDGDGNIVWTVSYGGKSLDQFSSISKTKSGDYILSGSTLSQSSNEDMWVMKIDENGDDIWGKTYGGIDDDYAVSIKEIPSGEFILVGQTRSSIRDNGLNILVSKLNSTGEKLWSSEINGKSDKIANSFSLLNDEKDGFIIIGQLRMKGGQSKILMIKMNQRGKIIWERTYGGNYISEGSSVLDDGTGLVVMGNHDIDSNGNSEIIFFKTDYDGKIMND